MTLAEAKLVLRVDLDDDDSKIQSLIDAIPSYIYQSTGLKPEDQALEPLVKVLEQYLIIEWYEHAEAYQKTIDALSAAIKFNAIEKAAAV